MLAPEVDREREHGRLSLEERSHSCRTRTLAVAKRMRHRRSRLGSSSGDAGARGF